MPPPAAAKRRQDKFGIFSLKINRIIVQSRSFKTNLMPAAEVSFRGAFF
jgi:hypothetical protein